jgi:hypothetical protein
MTDKCIFSAEMLLDEDKDRKAAAAKQISSRKI